jgi:small conductance mechanosensitive channel
MKDLLIKLNDMNMDQLVGWTMPYVTNVIIAIGIYFFGMWIIKRITNLLLAIAKKSDMDESLRDFLSAIVRTLLGFIVILIAIEQVGIDTSSLLALFGMAGLAVGLALKDSLSNFSAGVMLILFKPFKNGDFVKAAGISGVVEKISIFSTQMKTGDNQEIIVPNSCIYGDVIVNVSAKPTRRIDLTIGISYEDNLKDAQNIMLDILAHDERILRDPSAVVAVNELADSSVNFVVRPWVKSADYWAVKWDLLEKIKITFDEKGITIPYPQQELHLKNKGK